MFCSTNISAYFCINKTNKNTQNTLTAMQLTEDQIGDLEFYIAREINKFRNGQWMLRLYSFARELCKKIDAECNLNNCIYAAGVVRAVCEKLAPYAPAVCQFDDELWAQQIEKIKKAKY
jgi:ribosomal protein S6